MLPRVLSRLIVLCLGTLRAGYLSYKSYKVKDECNRKAWLKYWIVYSQLICVEFVTDLLIFWLPFYDEFKLALCIWLSLSAPSGSVWIFNNLMQPLLKYHEGELDQLLREGILYIPDDVKELGYKAMRYMKTIVLPLIIRRVRLFLFSIMFRNIEPALVVQPIQDAHPEGQRLVSAADESKEVPPSPVDKELLDLSEPNEIQRSEASNSEESDAGEPIRSVSNSFTIGSRRKTII